MYCRRGTALSTAYSTGRLTSTVRTAVWTTSSVFGTMTLGTERAIRRLHMRTGQPKKVKDITATTIDDCVKPDGTPIDLDLRMDIIYPSRPESEVPVMILASSAETRVDSWSASLRPHLTGYLFSGYAGVVYDHPYVPMARDDHYGYFDGTVNRTQRVYADGLYRRKGADGGDSPYPLFGGRGTEKYKFNKDKFGGYGHSKGAWVYLLGLPHPELEDENLYFYGHHGETAPGVTQPWLTHKRRYADPEQYPNGIYVPRRRTENDWRGNGADVYLGRRSGRGRRSGLFAEYCEQFPLL